MSLLVRVWLLLGTCLVLACGDRVTVNAVDKGAQSESCRSRNDCADGLRCIDMVCTAGAPIADDNTPTGAMDASVPLKTRSELGESCQKRADCAPPLACLGNTCLDEPRMDAGTKLVTSTRGRRGESCEATNDCELGLSCIGSRCLESDFALDFVPKQCFRVQCATSDDCCDDFKPTSYTEEQCDTMRDNCVNADGGVYPPPGPPIGVSSNDCTSWTNFCNCRLECQEEQCVNRTGALCLVDGQCLSGPRKCEDSRCVVCSSDSDCTSSVLPYCQNNQCTQCKADDDCPGSATRCVAGSCQAGCSQNEHCGQLEACQDGECVHVGCASDRQCYFLTGDDRSKCVEGGCQTPCENDAECVGDFQICDQSVCVFAGCETDEECRAALKIQNLSSTSLDRAVCREPAE